MKLEVFFNLFYFCIAGLQDSDDEDLENDIDQQIESIMAPKRIVKEIKASAVGAAGVPGMCIWFRNCVISSVISFKFLCILLLILSKFSSEVIPSTGAAPTGPSDKLELAKRLASRIQVAKNLGVDAKVMTQVTAEAILKGASSAGQPLITVIKLLIMIHTLFFI